MRLALVIMGILAILAALWLRAAKKLTVDLTVMWGSLGILFVLTGAITPLSALIRECFAGAGQEAAVLGIVCLAVVLQFSLVLSRLTLKNQDLAIEVSLLKQENKKNEKKELLVIMPAHNEERNIRRVLEQLKKQKIFEIADVLVVDDASSDATGQTAVEQGCILISNIFWMGYGSALQLGYRYAVKEQYQYVIQMDADGQHDVCNIPVIYRRLQEKDGNDQEPDIVLGSRFMEGSSDFRVIPLKRFAYAWFRLIIRAVTGMKIADPTTGLQGLSRKAFRYYSEEGHFDDRYPDANMVIQMLLLKFRVVQLPAVMHARIEGQSMHRGPKEAWYMCRMFFDIPAIVLRIRGFQIDRGAEDGDEL